MVPLISKRLNALTQSAHITHNTWMKTGEWQNYVICKIEIINQLPEICELKKCVYLIKLG